jgi:hypothetical protein
VRLREKNSIANISFHFESNLGKRIAQNYFISFFIVQIVSWIQTETW